MHDFEVLNNIEKYDAITDNWISVHYKLPVPLAQLSAVAVDKKNVLIVGGITAGYEHSKNAYNFDSALLKFAKLASMRRPRTCFAGTFRSADGCIYALLGSQGEVVCERYRIMTKKWEDLPHYKRVVAAGTNLDCWAGALIV